MIARDSDDKYVGVQCDECSCLAPDAATVLAGHGLINMGWHCSGGTHICPGCPHPEVEPKVVKARNER